MYFNAVWTEEDYKKAADLLQKCVNIMNDEWKKLLSVHIDTENVKIFEKLHCSKQERYVLTLRDAIEYARYCSYEILGLGHRSVDSVVAEKGNTGEIEAMKFPLDIKTKELDVVYKNLIKRYEKELSKLTKKR